MSTRPLCSWKQQLGFFSSWRCRSPESILPTVASFVGLLWASAETLFNGNLMCFHLHFWIIWSHFNFYVITCLYDSTVTWVLRSFVTFCILWWGRHNHVSSFALWYYLAVISSCNMPVLKSCRGVVFSLAIFWICCEFDLNLPSTSRLRVEFLFSYIFLFACWPFTKMLMLIFCILHWHDDLFFAFRAN